MKQLSMRIILILFFLLLISYPGITVSGASAGLLLWFHSIIPSLLPFMILSYLLVGLNGISSFTWLLRPLTGRIFGISEYGSYALLTGMVCGYPMGAKTCADLLLEKKISREEGQYLLCFVNNPGPAFVSGYLLQNVLGGRQEALPYFLAVYLSPLLFALLLRQGWSRTRKDRTKKEGPLPPFSPFIPDDRLDFSVLDRAIMNGFETVTRLGGYIILFSILSAFLLKADIISLPIKAVLLAATEITTGSRFLGSLQAGYLSERACGMAICACISFGGLSGVFQTNSVISAARLRLMPYIGSKLAVSLLSAVLYYLFAMLSGCSSS